MDPHSLVATVLIVKLMKLLDMKEVTLTEEEIAKHSAEVFQYYDPSTYQFKFSYREHK